MRVLNKTKCESANTYLYLRVSSVRILLMLHNATYGRLSFVHVTCSSIWQSTDSRNRIRCRIPYLTGNVTYLISKFWSHSRNTWKIKVARAQIFTWILNIYKSISESPLFTNPNFRAWKYIKNCTIKGQNSIDKWEMSLILSQKILTNIFDKIWIKLN